MTDRCNLRCIYCMPEEGIRLTGRENILQEPEIIRVCRVMAELGIKKIKITGGEPLVRPRMPGLIRQIKAIPGIEKVTLTTNGILLKKQMKELAEAGLDSLNISLDTLDRDGFLKITRRDLLDDTLAGIEEAMKYPNVQLKINCVPLGIEEQNLCEIAEFAHKYPVHVRFIEMMPIGYGSKYYTVDGFQCKIGFISTISHKFCSECNRIRLTSQGYLKTCLQYTAGRDLREALRNGGTDEELKEIIKAALSEKPDGHHFREKVKEDDTESLCMSQIGG